MNYSTYWAFIESKDTLQDEFVKYLLKNVCPFISPYGWYEIFAKGIKNTYDYFKEQLGYDLLLSFCDDFNSSEFLEFKKVQEVA